MHIPEYKNIVEKVIQLKNFLVNLFKTHTKKSVALGLVLLGLGYYYYTNSAATEIKYVVTKVTKGTIVASVTGTGQVTALNQIDIKTRASGDVLSLPAKSGATVRSGQTLATLDARDARKAVRDAQVSLDIARLDLKQLMEPNDSLAYLQAQHAIESAEQQKKDADRTVTTTYRTLLNTSFEPLPVTSADKFTSEQIVPIISGSYVGESQGEILIEIKGIVGDVPRFESSGIVSSYGNVNTVPQPLGSSGLYIQFPPTLIQNATFAGVKWSIKIPNTKASGYLSNNTAYQNALENKAKVYAEADRTIAEQKQKITDLKNGATPLEIESKKLAITQRQNALYDAQLALNDYTISAPFAGTLTTVSVQRGESISSGSTLATLITKKRVASVTLNEVDVARIKVGQKTTLTFDALEDFSVAGEVVEIDTVGAVTQGVVSYTVKIGFDTDEERIKPGMSVTANIVTDVKVDVVVAPSSAVKTKNGTSYVEFFDPPLAEPKEGEQGTASDTAPQQKNVQTGIASDTEIEIVSGLSEGDFIVTKAITATATKTTAAPSLFGAPGGGGTRQR